jgi:hypothetical protein
MQIPLERLLGETPDYTFFKVFGCACWPHIRPYNKRKFEFRSKHCVFLGYSSLHKGYKCLHVPTNRTYISRDVVFDETVFPFSQPSSSSTPPTHPHSSLSSDQFVDAAYTPMLLANHGAGQGRGARLELLDEQPATPSDPMLPGPPMAQLLPPVLEAHYRWAGFTSSDGNHFTRFCLLDDRQCIPAC